MRLLQKTSLQPYRSRESEGPYLRYHADFTARQAWERTEQATTTSKAAGTMCTPPLVCWRLPNGPQKGAAQHASASNCAPAHLIRKWFTLHPRSTCEVLPRSMPAGRIFAGSRCHTYCTRKVWAAKWHTRVLGQGPHDKGGVWGRRGGGLVAQGPGKLYCIPQGLGSHTAHQGPVSRPTAPGPHL